MATVLIIDDNPAVATALETLFSLHDVHTRSVTSPEDGLALLARESFDLVMQDMNFRADTTSGEEGVALFARDPRAIPGPAGDPADRVDAPRIGGRPGQGRRRRLPGQAVGRPQVAGHGQQPAGAVQRAARTGTPSCAANAVAATRCCAITTCAAWCYADPASETALALACQVARSELPVLVTGANGVGKEKYAEIIHANSAVRDGPFVALNCGALPSELIEAELFGADAGAYTGANRAREGKFEAADGGTLFLDEIGTLPPRAR